MPTPKPHHFCGEKRHFFRFPKKFNQIFRLLNKNNANVRQIFVIADFLAYRYGKFIAFLGN